MNYREIDDEVGSINLHPCQNPEIWTSWDNEDDPEEQYIKAAFLEFKELDI